MQTYFRQRIEVLTARLDNLRASLERARQSVTRLENESVPAGLLHWPALHNFRQLGQWPLHWLIASAIC